MNRRSTGLLYCPQSIHLLFMNLQAEMSVHAYGHDIIGRIVEVQTLEPIAGASVYLFTPDSTRVDSVVSTANGQFVLKKGSSEKCVVEAKK
jgi:hypothetical protein